MRKYIFITIIFIFIFELIISNLAFSEELRNPFKDWFPVIIKEEPVLVIEEMSIVIEDEPYFDLSQYTVEGLIWGISNPKAIINGNIYSLGDKLGDKFGGAEIAKISKDGITLIFQDEEYVITTKPVLSIKSEDDDMKNSDELDNSEVNYDLLEEEEDALYL